MNDWIEAEKELPLCDGLYEVTNDRSVNIFVSICQYDGYGFKYCDIYRIPKYWRYTHEKPKKRYGKQIDNKSVKT